MFVKFHVYVLYIYIYIYVLNICKYSVTITCTHNSYILNQLCIGRTSRNYTTTTIQPRSHESPGASLMTSYASSTHVVAIATFLSADPAVFFVYQKIWIQKNLAEMSRIHARSLSEFKAFLKISEYYPRNNLLQKGLHRIWPHCNISPTSISLK